MPKEYTEEERAKIMAMREKRFGAKNRFVGGDIGIAKPVATFDWYEEDLSATCVCGAGLLHMAATLGDRITLQEGILVREEYTCPECGKQYERRMGFIEVEPED